ncbi:MAG: preprotein translocase subunit YajC [Planctomycetota bacterium]
MLGMILIFYFLLIRPQMKETKRRKEMLSSVKKHDRVITSGGIYGVVVSVGDNEVVLKVDDSSNTRLKFTRAAIATILREEEGDHK